MVALLANELAPQPGVTVDVILFGRTRDVFYELHPSVRVLKPAFDFDNRLRGLSTLRTIAFLRAALRRGAYDAAVCFGERWNNLAMLSALGLDEPMFVSDRSSPSLRLGWAQESLRRLLYPRATGVIAQTTRARDQASSRGLNRRIVVMPNPVAQVPPLPAEAREHIVLTVGRLIHTKHHDRLIRLFATLGDQPWKLVVVGDDAQGQHHRERLAALVASLGLSDRVSLVGAQRDVASFYARASVFAFTSSSEGFPNVVAEALAHGLPVVSYDCDAGPSDLIEDGTNGYLVPLFNDDVFSDRLRKLMVDDRLRASMSTAARESVRRFSAEQIAAGLLAIVGGATVEAEGAS